VERRFLRAKRRVLDVRSAARPVRKVSVLRVSPMMVRCCQWRPKAAFMGFGWISSQMNE